MVPSIWAVCHEVIYTTQILCPRQTKAFLNTSITNLILIFYFWPVCRWQRLAMVSGAPFTYTSILGAPNVRVTTLMHLRSDENGNWRTMAISYGVWCEQKQTKRYFTTNFNHSHRCWENNYLHASPLPTLVQYWQKHLSGTSTPYHFPT